MKLPPAEAPRVVEEYGASARVTVEDDGRHVEATPWLQPTLEIRHRCSVPYLPDCKELRAPLGSVRLEAGVLRTSSPIDGKSDSIPAREVDEATLVLRRYEPPRWRPTWGIGGAVGGAAGAAAITLNVLPGDWIALEGGVLPAFVGDALGAYAAMRLRPVHFGFASPFVGGFVNGLRLFSVTGGRDEDEDGAGGRLGFDFESPRTHLIITIEADLVHPLPGSDGYFGFNGQWVPWGGGGVTYFF